MRGSAMLEKIHYNIKIMRICSLIETSAIIFVVMLIGLLADSLIEKYMPNAVVLSVWLFIVIVGFASAKILRKANKPDCLCYETHIEHTTTSVIAEVFSAKPVTEQAYVSFYESDGFDIRLLLLKCDADNRKKLRAKANKKINKVYGTREKQNYPLKDIRINLYIYESDFTYDLQMYASDMRLVDRVEPIFNFYVDMKKAAVFAPAIYGDYSFGQMSMYACAVDYVQSILP